MMEFSILSQLGIAALLCVVGMTATWTYARKIQNYSIVDVVWAYGFTAVALLFALTSGGWPLRRMLFLSLVTVWSLRLGTFLLVRIRRHHPLEDSRYVTLRREYGDRVAWGFFKFFQMQALSVVLLAVPFLLVSQNSAPTWSPFEIVGALLWLVGIFGETIADAQANRFKADPANRGRVCQEGLWRFSRHPNYFFETVVWWGFFVITLGIEGGVYTIYCPLVMTFLVVKVTGIPLAEKQSLLSRGDAYRDYQRRTSAFVPWFPRESKANGHK